MEANSYETSKLWCSGKKWSPLLYRLRVDLDEGENRPSPYNSLCARSSKICHGNVDCLIVYFLTYFFSSPRCRFHSHFQLYFINVFPTFLCFLLTFNFKYGQKKYQSEDWLDHVAHIQHGLKHSYVIDDDRPHHTALK